MKKAYILILSICFVLLFAGTAFASTPINETEPNDSATAAQLIQRNNIDPSSVPTAQYNGQNVVAGNVSSSTDQDWYKVYLPADSNTILGVNSSALSYNGRFQVYDENLNLISTISHVQDSAYPVGTPYYVNIPAAGYYYVKVTSTLNGGDYKFYIGGPDYTVNGYTYIAPSAVELTPRINSVQTTYDLRNVNTVPSNAIVYRVSIKGTETNSATNQYRSLRVSNDPNWITTSAYSYSADIPVNSNNLLRSQWVFKLDGKVSTSTGSFRLVPQIRFTYLYAILPR